MSMLSRLTLSTLLFVTLAMGNTAWAATYYVDRNLPGNDNNSGTEQDAPFLTIAKCVATATSPGDTCLVKNGTYPEAVLMRTSGTASAPITLKNFPGHRPVLDFGDTTDSTKMLIIKRAGTGPSVIQYIIVEGLEITGGWDGIKATTAENVIIRRNYIHHNGNTNGSGILCGFCYAWTFDRNIVAHNGSTTSSPKGHGHYIMGTGHIFTNNLIYGNASYGIQGSGRLFSSQTNSATHVRQSGFQATIANNTIAYNGTGGIVLTEAEHRDCIIENNLFYENLGPNGHPNGVNVAWGGGLGGHIIRNNYAYSTAPRGLLFIIGTSTAYTQTNNICLSGCSAVATNPRFVNAPATVPASPDFHLISGSQAIDFGVNLTSVRITTDITGLPRPQGVAFDVGAYEF